MPPLIEEKAGARYGRWMVLERADVPQGHKNEGAHWLCECDCGIRRVVLGVRLRRGNSKSCGCRWKLPEGIGEFNRLLRTWEASAKERGYEWQLGREQVLYLTKLPCHYCGAEPSHMLGRGDHNGHYIYNGLDRVDNDKGYLPENVVPCCKHCNRSKRTRSVDEFRNWILAVHKHFVVSEE